MQWELIMALMAAIMELRISETMQHLCSIVVAGKYWKRKTAKAKVSKAVARPSDNGLDKHWENFISVVRSRKMNELHCSVEDGAHVATVAQMGNISYLSGQRVTWDKEAEKFTDDDLNNKYLMKEYHNGYKLPS